MKIYLTTIIILAFHISWVFSQDCGTDEIHNHLFSTDTTYRNAFISLEEQVQSNLSNQQVQMLAGQTYTIPIVVHIIHLGESEGSGSNISNAQILGAVDGLNERFRNDIGAGVDTEIEFCLASVDPNGQPTNGIVRVDGSGVTGYTSLGMAYPELTPCAGGSETTLKSLSAWPTSDYYNIWIVHDICSSLGNIGGWAYYPGSAAGQNDGAVLLSSVMMYSNISLAHEVGHGFDLYHTFAGDQASSSAPVQCPSQEYGCGSFSGDCCDDTPAHTRNTSDCQSSSNPCGFSGVWNNSRYNYMSYCFPSTSLGRFTDDQKNRMQTALQLYPRSELLNSQGCNNTGCTPDNDVCSSNVPTLPVGQSCSNTTGDLACATQSYAASGCPSSIIQDVWYKFIASSGQYTITLDPSSGLDGVIEARQGSCSGTILGCIDVGGGPGNVETLVINPSSGTVYIRVYDSTQSGIPPTTTTFVICVTHSGGSSCTTPTTPTATYPAGTSQGNATFVYSQSVNLTWTDVGASCYYVYVRDLTTSVVTTYYPVSGNSLPLTGLTNYTDYAWNVRADESCDGSCTSSYSPERFFYICNCTAPVAATSISSSLGNTICSGQSTTLSPVGGTAGSCGQWVWYTDGCNSNGNLTPVYWGATYDVNPSSTTTYWVQPLDDCHNSYPSCASIQIVVSPNVSVNVNSSNSTICAGSSTTLSANGANNYSWSPSTGLSSTTASTVTASPSTTTTYTVTGTNGGCTNDDQITVTVNSNPNANAGSNVNIPSGGSTTLNGSGGVSCSWSPAPGLDNPNSCSPNASPTASTIYTLTVTDGNGCAGTDNMTVTVTGSPLSVSSSATLQTICEGETSQLNAIASGGSGSYTYSWTSSPSGFTSNSGSPTVSPTQTTTYTVVVNDGNSTASSSVIVTVSGAPTANAGSDVTISSGGSTTLNGSGGVSCLWSPTTGLSNPNVCNPTASPSTTTTYTLTVTDSNGCTDDDDVEVEVEQPIECDNSTASVSPNPISIPAGGGLGSAVVTFSPSDVNCTWSVSQGTCSWVTNLQPTSGQSANGNITFDVGANSGAARSCTLQVTAGTNTYDLIVNQASDTDPCNPPVLTLNGCELSTPELGAASYQWYVSGNMVGNGTRFHDVSQTGDGNYYLVVTDADGCTAQSVDMYVDYDGTNCIIIGISETDISSFQLVPNPSTGQFELILPKVIEKGNYQIFDNMGQLLKNGTITSDRTRIDMSQHAEGVYMLRLLDGQELLGVERIVLMK